MGPTGWWFAEGPEGAKADALRPGGGRLALHRVYTAADPQFTGHVTVPVLWDKETGTIVNNESSEIIRMLDAELDGFGARGPRYYVPELASEIDALNARVYAKLNNGIYRAGFARSQAAYEEAVRGVFEVLDELEAFREYERLSELARQGWIDAPPPCLAGQLDRLDRQGGGLYEAERTEAVRLVRAAYPAPEDACAVLLAWYGRGRDRGRATPFTRSCRRSSRR
jgi:hypothetical protein